MKFPDEIREYFRNQGRIGGKRRARNLTAAERRASARKAVQARWAKWKRENAEKQK